MRRILNHRLLLSVLCILLGTAPLVGLLNVMEAGQSMLKSGFGKSSLFMKASWEGAGIGSEDLQELREQMPEIKSAIPDIELKGSLKSFKDDNSSVQLKAVGSGYDKYAALSMKKGRFISREQETKRLNVAVLDDLTADELFGTTDVVGRSLEILTAGTAFEVKIVGVCKRMDISGEQLKQDTGIAFIPASFLQYQTGQPPINSIFFAIEGIQQEEAKAKLEHFLQSKGAVVTKDDISALSQVGFLDHLLQEYQKVFLAAAILWFFAALVALIYIFLLDVEQNKKYLGLLLFYGNPVEAVKGLIYDKAFTVSVISSLASGIIGLGASLLICGLLNIPFFLSIHSITAAIVLPAVLCAAAVIYPSSKAIRLDAGPIIWQNE